MQITFAGTGDAFGAGGRFNTCFHMRSSAATFLIDCGASALVSLHRLNLDPDEIDAIFISHLHGDHFGGLPNLLMEAHYVNKRTRPLVLAGPYGFRDRLMAAMEALYPDSSKIPWKFDLTLVQLATDAEKHICGVGVRPFEVDHFSGAPSCALRISVDGKVITYSGDTQWTENLVAAAWGADLFICECYMYDRDVSGHLSYLRIAENVDRFNAKRICLTHMGPQMLKSLDKVDRSRFSLLDDGMVIDL